MAAYRREEEEEEEEEEGGRRQKSKHGQALYTLTPDCPPLAASTGNNRSNNLMEFA